jgi:hypothetical protein
VRFVPVSGPDENLLEVWVVAAEVSPGVLSLGSSSFVLLDFFDYESQVHTQHDEGSGEAQGFEGATHTITQRVAGMHIPSCVPLPLTYASLCVGVLFEHQATPFVLGNSPKYDFATTYKVTQSTQHIHAHMINRSIDGLID